MEDKIPDTPKADNDTDATQAPPPPVQPAPVERNKYGSSDNSHNHSPHITKTTEKPERHWTLYVEAMCGVALVIITFYYTRYAGRQAVASEEATNATHRAVCVAAQTLDYTKAQNAAQALIDASTREKSDKDAKAAARLSAKSLQATIDNFHLEQRAFVSFDHIVTQRLPVGTPQEKHKWAISAQFQNSGNTSAINAISNFRSERRSDVEPTETEFIRNTQFVNKFYIGPHANTLSQEIIQSEKSFIGLDEPETARGDYFPGSEDFLWGWIVYRDVFPKTPVRVTEFCQKIERVTLDNSTNAMTYSTYACSSHNCTDETCKDYKEMAAKLN